MKIPKLFSLNQLNRRERMMVLVGALVVGGFGLWGLSGIPVWYFNQMKTLERLIQQKQQDRIALAQLRQEYTGLKLKLNLLENRIAQARGFSLVSHLESLAVKEGVRQNIAYMRPQPPADVDRYKEVGVEIKVDNITLNQAVKFLSLLETGPHLIKIKNLRLRTRFADPRYLDAAFLATTYEEK